MRIIQKMFFALITSASLLSTGAATADDIAAREQTARATSGALLQQLGGTLKQELQTGGPEKAITVCRDIAPKIANELSITNGWKVTRVGTRVRNPLLGMPDDWERRVLADFEARAAKGEAYKDMVFGEVVKTGSVKQYRFAKAIPVQENCLLCHGSAEQIPDVVKAKLKNTYPHDMAKGYKVGDLRGAVSIIQPLDIPLVGK